MTDIDTNERATVARTSFNVANVIIAIAILILVLGVLKYFHALPF